MLSGIWTIGLKHKGLGAKKIVERYGWRKPGYRSIHWKDGKEMPLHMATVRVGPFLTKQQKLALLAK